jgi:hypothetical protein
MLMEEAVSNFLETGEKLEFEIKKALIPLGIYAFKIVSTMGSGRMEIEARAIDFGEQREIRHLKDEGLIDFLNKETLCDLKERGLIPE